jgi:hypothetical protein
MISRRGVILAASSLVLTLCASCGDAGVTGDDNEESGSGSLEATRKHISSDNVVGVFLFSLDGQSIAAIGADDLQEAIEILCDLDSETSEEPAAVPEGGVSGGRERMFFVVLESSETVAVGTDGSCAIYDSVSFESSYDACQSLGDLYSRLIEMTSF